MPETTHTVTTTATTYSVSCEDAMRLAREHAPQLKVNGLTAAEVVERRQRAVEKTGAS